MKIGELAQSTKTSTATIRYYESIGLMPPAQRHSGNQRTYTGRDKERLSLIRRCRHLGFTLDEIRQLIAIAKSNTASAVSCREIVALRLDDVRDQARRLKATETRLLELLNSGPTETTEPCDHLVVFSAR